MRYLYCALIFLNLACDSAKKYDNSSKASDILSKGLCVLDSIEIIELAKVYSYHDCSSHSSKWLEFNFKKDKVVIHLSDLFNGFYNANYDRIKRERIWFVVNSTDLINSLSILDSENTNSRLENAKLDLFIEFYTKTIFGEIERVSIEDNLKPKVVGEGFGVSFASTSFIHYFSISEIESSGSINIIHFILIR
jgi:hypothetical protein